MKSKLAVYMFTVFSFLWAHLAAAQAAENQAPAQRLKVAFVIDTYDQLKSGGIISANRFIQALKQHHDVTIVATGESEEGKVAINSFYFPLLKDKMQRNGMVFGRASTAQLREAFTGVDLVYVHFPFYLGMKALRVAKSMGLPTVAGFHVQPENLLFNIGIHSDVMNKKLYEVFIKNFYNNADMIVCPSVFAQKLLTANASFRSKTVVISNGLTDDFRPRPSPEKFNHPDGKFTILTVGRLAKEKRHDVILKAIEESKYKDRIQLVITGDGALKESLIAASKHLPNKPQIGYVTKEELHHLYNSADLYIHASEIELEGMSVLEAIGCGMAALISDADTSASKQFALNDDFLFTTGNASELSAKIDYWIEHPEELKQRSLDYAESAKAYYFETSLARLENVFVEAIANHQPAPVQIKRSQTLKRFMQRLQAH